MVTCPSDTELLVFVEGGHDDAMRIRIEEHLDVCRDCRAVVADVARASGSGSSAEAVTELALEPPSERAPRPGTTLGRYVVIDELGRGGAGIVLRAYDPKLQREVALKLVRTEGMTADAQARVIREARAMARLSHPNVVRIYDVEVEPDRVLLAMELVEGGTLAQWLRSRERDWRVVLERFGAAGRGLAAAHAVGLLHRDFKPANVLVEGGGAVPVRVRVTDFGLARMHDDAWGDVPTRDDAAAPSDLDEARTEAGIVMGTLVYMAPEQHRGEELSPAADQFAFCVALWEGLTGQRPYAVTSSSRLWAAKSEGPPAWPRTTRVPRRVIEAIRKGLAADPADRFADMPALLAALSDTPSRRRTGVAVAIALVGITAAVMGARASGPSCDDAGAEIGAAWGDEPRAAVQAGIEGSGLPYAAAMWRETRAQLDAWTQQWTAASRQLCEAGPVATYEANAPAECLRHARLELEVTTALLAAPDPARVARAPTIAAALPSVTACVDPRRSWHQGPESDEARPVVRTARDGLGEVRALRKGGALDTAEARLDALSAVVDASGDASLQVETSLERARLAAAREHDDDAATRFGATLTQALEIGAWQVAGLAALGLVDTLGARGHDTARALGYVDLARGLLAEPGDELERAQLHEAVAQLQLRRGDPTAAVAEQRHAVELYGELLGPEAEATLAARSHLARALLAAGSGPAARAELRSLLAARTERWGEAHPETIALRRRYEALPP